jgi:hypothetical protein
VRSERGLCLCWRAEPYAVLSLQLKKVEEKKKREAYRLEEEEAFSSVLLSIG